MRLIGRTAPSASTVFTALQHYFKMTVPHPISVGGDVLRRANVAWGFSTDIPVVAGTPYHFVWDVES